MFEPEQIGRHGNPFRLGEAREALLQINYGDGIHYIIRMMDYPRKSTTGIAQRGWCLDPTYQAMVGTELR